MIAQLVESLIRNISGRAGIVLRRIYYQNRFAKCGSQLVISEGVFIDQPKNVELGNNVWIDKGVIIITGSVSKKQVKKIRNVDFEGKLVVGSDIHIGIRTIIQAHGGIQIGNFFTTGSDAKLYSLSNNVRATTHGTHPINEQKHSYVIHPLEICNNVWIGMNAVVLGGEIKEDVYVRPNSVIKGEVASNQIIGQSQPQSKEQRLI